MTEHIPDPLSLANNSLTTSAPTGPPSSIIPSFGLKTHQPFTIVYTLLYSGIFLFVYFQLWLILYHGHKRFSYQTVFLYLCLVWSALRTTLFSFFFKDAASANELSFFPYWLLFCFPSIVQYAIMTLLLVFFSQLIVPAHLRDPDQLIRRRRRIFVTAGIGFALFLITNLVCASLTKYLYLTDLYLIVKKANIVLARVVINDGLFMICAVCLSVCIVKLTKRPSARVAFEAKDIGVPGAIALAVICCVLFVSRGIYNFLAVFFKVCPSFGYGWINVSDQADLSNLSDEMAYFTFGLVLLFWECLPTTMIVLFFDLSASNQVKTRAYTSQDTQEFQSRIMGSLPGIAGASTASQLGASYFFDNRNRYNSIDDISRTTSPQSPRSPAFDIYTINNGGGGGGGTAAFGGHSSSFGRYSQSQTRISPVGSLGVGSYTRQRDSSQYPTVHVINGGSGRGAANENIAGAAINSRMLRGGGGFPSMTAALTPEAAPASSTMIHSTKSAPNLLAVAGVLGKRGGGDAQRQRMNQETNSIIEEDADADEQSEMNHEAAGQGKNDELETMGGRGKNDGQGHVEDGREKNEQGTKNGREVTDGQGRDERVTKDGRMVTEPKAHPVENPIC